MNGCRYFSKLDLNQAFFQFEISEDSKRLTTFYANGKLMRLNRLPQGVLPASSELDQALQQILAHIPEVRVLYDDILIATETREQQYEAIEKVFHTIAENGLTLKKSKCIFVVQDIPFWGMRITKDGVKPCPKKCEAVQNMEPPRQKEDVASFLSMLQAHANFIPHFSKLTANIRELQKQDVKFKWEEIHQKEFDDVKDYFLETTTLAYYEANKPTWIFEDAAREGLGAIIAQGPNINDTNIVAFASCTTTNIEKRYPQIDLEAMAVDFGLRRFREYCVGAKSIKVVTDHRPLKAIFANKRLGSIRIDRTKLRHQDIDFEVIWRAGKMNPSDYLSRHTSNISKKYAAESLEDAKLLYTLHDTDYVLKEMTTELIKEELEKDDTLKAVMVHVQKGK